jgi:hypothetical protein
MRSERGAAGFVGIVADLLAATFGAASESVSRAAPAAAPREGGASDPFPGRT